MSELEEDATVETLRELYKNSNSCIVHKPSEGLFVFFREACGKISVVNPAGFIKA